MDILIKSPSLAQSGYGISNNTGSNFKFRVLFLRGIYYSFLTEGVRTDQVWKLSNYLLVNNLKTVFPVNSFRFSSLVGNFKMKNSVVSAIN